MIIVKELCLILSHDTDVYLSVLDSEDAALIAPEFGCNAVLDEVAAFDIYPP
jgi:hypothetical protein